MIESKRPSVTCLNGQPRVSVLPKRVSGPLSQGYESQCYQISLGRISDLFSRWHNYIHGGPTFDPVLKMKEVKTHFWSTFISSNWIKSEFSISLKADQKWVFEQIETRDHKIRREIGVDQKWNGMHMLHVTYLLHTQNWIKSCTPA